jgi:hypothetical protein
VGNWKSLAGKELGELTPRLQLFFGFFASCHGLVHLNTRSEIAAPWMVLTKSDQTLSGPFELKNRKENRIEWSPKSAQ